MVVRLEVPRWESLSIQLHQFCAHSVSRQTSQTFQKKDIIKARAYHQNLMGFICILLKTTVVGEEKRAKQILQGLLTVPFITREETNSFLAVCSY